MNTKHPKIAIITGASRGIGAKTAILLANQGFHVVIVYKQNQSAAEQVCQQVNLHDGSAEVIQCDVSNETEVISLFNQVDNISGDLVCLVNNVGIMKPQGCLLDLDAARVNEILTKNVTSHFLCAKEAVKRMSSKFGGKGGSIVNVSSGASKTGSPNEYLDYAASKGAIDTFTIGLAKEVANQGIRVNCVRPGLIYTDMHADGGEAGRVDRLKHNLPLQRGGKAEEVAEAIYWLASNKSSFTTGSFIDVTGGF